MKKKTKRNKQNIWQSIARIIILLCIFISGYTTQNTQELEKAPDTTNSLLKSGALISYFSTTSAPFTYEGTIDKVIGAFDIHVNGNEGPNIAGRDFYSFYITDKGKIVDNYYNSENVLLSTKQTACQRGSAYARFGAVVDDGWRINY